MKKSGEGYTLVELLVVVIIISIMATIALKSLKSSTTVARVEETRQKLEKLSWGIAGNPELLSGGSRSSYGFVGDNGAMPTSLGALVTNPGGWTTWKGPYYRDDFSTDGSSPYVTTDSWGATLSYASSGVTITSTGSGSNITRNVATQLNDLLYNPVIVTVVDNADTPPGSVYKDSTKVLLTVPNGTGSITTKLKYPAKDGLAQFDSIPIGAHPLMVVYVPYSDTLRSEVRVNPGSATLTRVSLYRKVW